MIVDNIHEVLDAQTTKILDHATVGSEQKKNKTQKRYFTFKNLTIFKNVVT